MTFASGTIWNESSSNYVIETSALCRYPCKRSGSVISIISTTIGFWAFFHVTTIIPANTGPASSIEMDEFVPWPICCWLMITS
jgi:hypothetical protein